MDTDTAEGPQLVLQGKFADAVTRAACSQDSPPAHDESVIRIPVRMVAQIREACDAAETASALLDSARTHAFHLELRDVYAVGEEREAYDAFLRDGSVPADDSAF
ncbi:hypothetical protein HZZ00_18315 [Streptomyces sp. NEAU-sy36]|nr:MULTISPECIES: DUF6879 family protein [unclassified Streptomyces]QLI99512.1 hypothetical protein HZZ00_18315 [Streptomyces sp. NEAU-sy36]